jgi:hypothetical protein
MPDAHYLSWIIATALVGALWWLVQTLLRRDRHYLEQELQRIRLGMERMESQLEAIRAELQAVRIDHERRLVRLEMRDSLPIHGMSHDV